MKKKAKKGFPLLDESNGEPRGIAVRRKTDAVVVPVPYSSVDESDEDSCFMLLTLYVPFRSHTDLLPGIAKVAGVEVATMTAVEAFRLVSQEPGRFGACLPPQLLAKIRIQSNVEQFVDVDDDEIDNAEAEMISVRTVVYEGRRESESPVDDLDEHATQIDVAEGSGGVES